MARLNCKILSLEALNRDTRRLVLALPKAAGADLYKPGQYLEIILPGGRGCPFSIAGAPSDSGLLELHVRPTPGSADSDAIEQLISSREEVEIEIPKGDCFIDRMPRLELLLIAASTGITQMKSILEFLLGKGLQHPVHLYWGVLHSSDLYLNEQCQKWAQQHAGFHYVPVVSEPQNDPDWQGRKGLVGEVALSDFARVSPGTGFRRAWHGACHL